MKATLLHLIRSVDRWKQMVKKVRALGQTTLIIQEIRKKWFALFGLFTYYNYLCHEVYTLFCFTEL